MNYSTKKELEDAIDDKTYIIEGFGIRNNDVPIKDISGKNLVIDTQDGRWAKLDNYERIIFKDRGSAKAIFGLGEGFVHFRTNYFDYTNHHGTNCLNQLLAQLGSKTIQTDD